MKGYLHAKILPILNWCKYLMEYYISMCVLEYDREVVFSSCELF